MPTCSRCNGLTKALLSAEKQNLAHVKRADSLEALIRDMLDHGKFSPAVLERVQTTLDRLPGPAA
jgi:hypothetical protein